MHVYIFYIRIEFKHFCFFVTFAWTIVEQLVLVTACSVASCCYGCDFVVRTVRDNLNDDPLNFEKMLPDLWSQAIVLAAVVNHTFGSTDNAASYGSIRSISKNIKLFRLIRKAPSLKKGRSTYAHFYH